MNFHKNENMETHEKGLRWVLLALYNREDLERACLEIFSDADFLLLYSLEDSYMWQCRKEIL